MIKGKRRIRSDGNGGWDVNVQRKEWWKVGLIGAVLVGAFTMAGETLIEDIHGLVIKDSLTEHRLEQLEARQENVEELVSELRDTMMKLDLTQQQLVEVLNRMEIKEDGR